MFVGLLVFLAGVGLLGLTFKIAFESFATPPQQALGISANKPIDLGVAGSNFAVQLLRVFLLLVMAVVGSIIANRGVHLYTSGRHLAKEHQDPVA